MVRVRLHRQIHALHILRDYRPPTVRGHSVDRWLEPNHRHDTGYYCGSLFRVPILPILARGLFPGVPERV